MKTWEDKKNPRKKAGKGVCLFLKENSQLYVVGNSITDTEDRVNLNLDSVAGNYEHYCRTKVS